jgi:beta-glucosidase-like glycosyl hydrolase/CubicO group peptidase (beta-lactamase class C family)
MLPKLLNRPKRWIPICPNLKINNNLMRKPKAIYTGIIACVFFLCGTIVAQPHSEITWVDSVLHAMSLDEKIGQLFMIRAHSDLGEDHIKSVLAQIKKYKVGGLCFFQGTPDKQTELTVQYQKESEVPLLISMDAEWGLGMRLKEKGLSFPRQIMLGAVQDEKLIEEMGFRMAEQLKAMGVHINFAPVADINTDPLNPVIGDRSFGEIQTEVASRAIAYMKGLQAGGIMPCAKHFPGHGDTRLDSHFDLPVIPHDIARLHEVELYPFQQMIKAGLPSMMVAHLHVPAIDTTAHISTTLSVNAINGLLKQEMGFEGLVITDALEMKGVTKHFRSDEIAIMAFVAGNDILLMPSNIDLAFAGLRQAFKKGILLEEVLDLRVRKILEAKYRFRLDSLVLPDPVMATSMAFDANAIGVKHKLIEEAITVAQNHKAYIPLVNIIKPKIATLALGSATVTKFQERLDSYMEVDHYHAPHSLAGTDQESLIKELRRYDKIIVSTHHMTNKAQDQYGLTKEMLGLIQWLNRETEIILVVFGTPYSLQYFENIGHIIMAYEDTPETEDITAQGLMGVFGFRGKLPVTASSIFPALHGFTTPSLQRMGYSVPERVGMVSDSLNRIGEIAAQMVRERAAPGCQVVIARDGRIIYQKAFGHHTYSGEQTVQLTDLYDVASITKVVATTPAVMMLTKEGVMSMQKALGQYLPWLKGSNKQHMVLERVMAHHAGLKSWIPFFENTIRVEEDTVIIMQPSAYCDQLSVPYMLHVGDGLFLDTMYIDSLRNWIIQSPLNADGQYVYSDLGFIMLAEIIRNETGMTLDKFAAHMFYEPMGLRRIGYQPLKQFDPGQIVPSEIDDYFRCQELDGYVHDMASAFLGGVSGNAGVFSNAEDIAIFFQMIMNGGRYGGWQYLDPELIKSFTTRYQHSTRRGIGFDMKELDTSRTQLTSRYSSNSTYGHTGFTGACVWNDPEQRLTYVFLSNRTYPTMRNDKLQRLNIRERIHSRAYRAITGYQPYIQDKVQG